MQDGGPLALEFGKIEIPKPGPGVELVEVAGVNFSDTCRRSGVHPME